jgi:hypothetical protein
LFFVHRLRCRCERKRNGREFVLRSRGNWIGTGVQSLFSNPCAGVSWTALSVQRGAGPGSIAAM